MSYTVVPSAYKSVDVIVFSKTKGKSLINIKNMSGPKIAPCGTPDFMGLLLALRKINILFYCLVV